jgi:phosphoglycolate phosphatase
MVRVVLFDIDGTLIRTGGAGTTAFARTSALAFGRPGGTQGLVFHGRTDTSLVREYLRLHGMIPALGVESGAAWEAEGSGRAAADTDTDTEAELVRHFLETYLFLLDDQLEASRGEICPGVSDWLDGLAEAPDPPVLGLLTGNIRLGAELKLRAHGLWDRFEVGAFADDHQDRGQIAAAAKRRAERRLGRPVSGEEVVVVGDTALDVACARAIGARCLAVATGGVPEPELARHEPDWLVPDLRALPVREWLSQN